VAAAITGHTSADKILADGQTLAEEVARKYQ
jgi:hypothetical protein